MGVLARYLEEGVCYWLLWCDSDPDHELLGFSDLGVSENEGYLILGSL